MISKFLNKYTLRIKDLKEDLMTDDIRVTQHTLWWQSFPGVLHFVSVDSIVKTLSSLLVMLGGDLHFIFRQSGNGVLNSGTLLTLR